ncbi:hypothetical protein [Candidatus Poriferisodalis sp.]|uniref:hypothetical protein n=1 Tax=Candidatus Poriferisodalis sp. TaxID=3101277 RepID=UPI003AF4A820
MTNENDGLRGFLQDKTNHEVWRSLGGRGPITDFEIMPAAAEFNRSWEDFNAAVLVLETSEGGRRAFAASERQLVNVAKHILRTLAPRPEDEVLAVLREIRDAQEPATAPDEQSEGAEASVDQKSG